MCHRREGDPFANCIDTYGSTKLPVPSSTIAVASIPTEQAVAINSNSIVYTGNWTDSSRVPSCAKSPSLRLSHQINSSVELNYTGKSQALVIIWDGRQTTIIAGPSIIFHAVRSRTGGAFSVIVDGFNTSSPIDTYTNSTLNFTECTPIRFPPFIKAPPDYLSRTNHTIKLVFQGVGFWGPLPADLASNKSMNVQFDSFAVPDDKYGVPEPSHGDRILISYGFLFLSLAMIFALL